jgi:nucleotidyltransferase/DNA polymerase involved in DNA repair
LKGKPVLVGSTGERGVVSAASYEARDFGVFSATPISIARKRCPDGIYLPVDFEYYRKQSKEIMTLFSQFTSFILQVSVDEAYLDLTDYASQFASWEAMAEHIKREVTLATELTCSIGVSESRIVSKIASDFNKPNGVTIVHDMNEFLQNLPIGKVPGIGKRSQELYNKYDIRVMGDFAKKSNAELFEKFGQQGLFYKRLALGEDRTELEAHGKQKSASREHTLYKNTSDIILLENILGRVCEQLYKDLDGKFFKTVSIKLRYDDFTTLTRDERLKTPANSLDMIKAYAFDLFRRTITNRNVRLLGVKVGHLEKGQVTLQKFSS